MKEKNNSSKNDYQTATLMQKLQLKHFELHCTFRETKNLFQNSKPSKINKNYPCKSTYQKQLVGCAV